MKTLSYETCKKLKEVLNYVVVLPTHFCEPTEPEFSTYKHPMSINAVPAWSVQDILSRPFLEELITKLKINFGDYDSCPLCSSDDTRWYSIYEDIGVRLLKAYWQSQERFEEVLRSLIEKK